VLDILYWEIMGFSIFPKRRAKSDVPFATRRTQAKSPSIPIRFKQRTAASFAIQKGFIMAQLERLETEQAVSDKVMQDAVIKIILPFEYAEDEHYYIEPLSPLTKKPLYSFLKRSMDIAISLVGLILMALPMSLIAIAIKCTSKGKVLYSQPRLGLNGVSFNVVKFRTMVSDAEQNGAQWSQGESDERITKVGAFLRKTRLDELPQLWGCLKGELSIVGPRPEREVFYNEFEKHVHGFSERLKVKPGLTGLAQISGGYNLRPEEKAMLDIEYIKNRSIWLDIKILFKTVGVVIKGSGAK
jgi:lipopolysaccharide/colanic/teichoic acid biosynthesis glycosyltransferase